ncbi:CocE/NonD family hydrolase [Rhodovastum atsumiense]|uniref:CocE/NonD family hydrolase n=1 Tax=Rhodovastum atsumiense TaxID=504468 RepID=A0A5M6INL6_9PROT|nr:CocE/NonD family hydrolase [Rhodovastum atsumiense]KAA5609499.1 CocE/NonD family hydrolase [Rhodovastum atsumiense]CAH2600803.1 CocE/NonD family hydrolase [Rhodovastum atsumiense]
MPTEMVAMRDGVRLATDIYLPEGTGPWPVVLERTPYGRAAIRRSELSQAEPAPVDGPGLAARFTARGYAVVLQDCRGRHGSEGRFVKYLADAEDGVDTCQWITSQPWCDGHICTIGLSYGAHAAAALGCLDPPGVIAQVLDSGGFNDAWTSGIRHNGAFELRHITWALREARQSPEALADPVLRAALEAEDIHAWITRLPWRPGHSPLRHHPDYEAYLLDQLRHGPRDGFWKQAGIWAEGFYHRFSRADCVHMSSWFDAYVPTAIGNFCGLSAAGRGRQRLILGPWTHGDRSGRVAGDVDFGPEAPIDSWAGDWLSYRLRHFEAATQGTANTEPPVRVFVMGGGSGRRTEAGHLDHGGRWITATDWPPAEVAPQVLHLHADGRLDAEASDNGGALAFDFDPANPVPTIGGSFASLEPLAVAGSFDQVESPEFFGCRPPYLPLASRPDVLVFQTAPLADAVQVVGRVEFELWVATNGPDTDFTVKLIDVHPANADYPRGYAMLLGDTIQRLRYAEDPGDPQIRRPGEVVRIRLGINIANLFLPGHRIRIDVSSSNFPKFDVNPNTGEPDGMSRRHRVAVNTVFCDRGRPSRVTLPVLPL